MHHRQHIDRIIRDRMTTTYGSPVTEKPRVPPILPILPSFGNWAEHHRGLEYTARYPVGRSIIVLSDPVANVLQIAARLRREANSQA